MFMDLSSPNVTGVFIGVKDGRAPPQKALLLADALKEAGVEFRYWTFRQAEDDYLAFIVGYR